MKPGRCRGRFRDVPAARRVIPSSWSILGWGFAEGLHVVQYAMMDRVDNRIRPFLPVGGRPQVVLIPGGAFEQGSSAWQRFEPELTLFRNEKSLQVRRMNFMIGRPLL